MKSQGFIQTTQNVVDYDAGSQPTNLEAGVEDSYQMAQQTSLNNTIRSSAYHTVSRIKPKTAGANRGKR